jgi:ADP-heptose:LPS heptosyltransferase
MKPKILVFQPWGIGDILMFVPALCILNDKGYSDISLCSASAETGKLLLSHKLISKHHAINWTKNKLNNLLELLIFSIKNRGLYDFIFIPVGLRTEIYLFLKYLCGGKIIFKKFDVMKETRWRIAENINLLQNHFPDIDLTKVTEQHFSPFCSKVNNQRSVCFFLGGNLQSKRAPLNVCAEIAANLIRNDYAVYEISDNCYPLSEVVDGINKIPISHLSDLDGFFTTFKFFISGDTGLAHLAALCGCVPIVFSGATRIQQSRPGRSVIISSIFQPTCSPCYGTLQYGNCQSNYICVTSINAVSVLNFIEMLQTKEKLPFINPYHIIYM